MELNDTGGLELEKLTKKEERAGWTGVLVAV
jgi:hypothetical protein